MSIGKYEFWNKSDIHQPQQCVRSARSASKDLIEIMSVEVEIGNAIDRLVDQPESLVDGVEAFANLNSVAKLCFDSVSSSFVQSPERESCAGPLEELVLNESFGLDQIWQQLQLQDQALLKYAQSKLKSFEDSFSTQESDPDHSESDDFETENIQEQQYELSQEEEDDDSEVPVFRSFDHGDDDSEEENEEETRSAVPEENNSGGDRFFNLEDMDRFADEMEEETVEKIYDQHLGYRDGEDEEEEEEEVNHDEEEDIDAHLFAPDSQSADDRESTARFADFFDNPDTPVPAKAAVVEDTPFQRYQREIQMKIAQLEEENLGDKDWDMTGESSAKQRPKDSLLTKHLDFEFADKVAPPITEEFNISIEKIIKRRILDRAWDDVQKFIAPEAKPFKLKEDLETDKSELGLAEVYEKEYVEKVSGIKESEEKLSAEHQEIAELFSKLCYQLDSLSNFHFTPNPLQKEIQVRSNVSAISMEEAMPVSVTNATAVAPEELYKANQAPVGETELQREELKRNRQARKRKFKKSQVASKIAEEGAKNLSKKKRKASPDQDVLLMSRHNVIKVSGEDKTEYSNSSAVFQKIQQQEAAGGDGRKKKTLYDLEDKPGKSQAHRVRL